MMRHAITKSEIKLGLLLVLLVGSSVVVFRSCRSLNIGAKMYALGNDPEDMSQSERQDTIDNLASYGSESQSRIIDEVRHTTYWDLRMLGFSKVLKKIGPSAHQRLLKAIKEEKSPIGRFRCTYVLQLGFHDYSQFDKCIYALIAPYPAKSGWQRTQNAQQLYALLQSDFEDGVPFILIRNKDGVAQSKVDRGFVDWAKEHSKPKGPLPQLHLSSSQIL